MDAPIPTTALAPEVLRAALEALDRGERVIVASVVARRGSAPSTPGQKLALFVDGTARGTIGGGAVEKSVLAEMIATMAEPAPVPKLSTFRLGPSLGMCCGGSVDMLIEALLPPRAVLVVGAGHVGAFVAPLLASLGFRVTLCDARESATAASRLGRAGPVTVLCADHDDPEVGASIGPSVHDAAVLVMTHDHQLDQAAIAWALARGFGFVGGVGSRAKAARTRSRLDAQDVAGADRVRMPVGLSIGARTPAEIGIAIAAELIAWRAACEGRSVTKQSDDASAEEPGDP